MWHAHFIGNNGFEAVIEKNRKEYRVGWRSKQESNFFFIRCPFKPKRDWEKYHYRTGKEIRINQWTTFNVAKKEFQQLIKHHQTVNFK